MKLWLTRQRNGMYMLTKYKPVITLVEGRGYNDVYVVPGEPIGIRNLCDAILTLVRTDKPLKRGESVEVLLGGKVLNENCLS